MMKTFIKRLAMILVIVLSTESVMANTIVSSDNSYNDFESIVSDYEHSELAIETTTDGIDVPDEIITPSGIIVDMLSFLRNLKNDIIKDGVVSPSAIDYEIDGNLTKDIKDLLDENYKSFNETEKFLLNKYLSVREDTMTVCCEKGLDVEGSIPYALIMQILQVDFDDAKAMVISNESESKAVEAAYGFGNLFMDNGKIIDDELRAEFTEYAIVGYSADEVFNAYIFSIFIGSELSEVIHDKTGQSDEEDVLFEYEDTISKYCINQSAIETYLDMGCTIDVIGDNIKATIKELNESQIALYSADDDNFDVGYDASFKEGALSYVKGINDNIDPSTGALAYSEIICSLPGINGLDLNLSINYTSNTTNMAKSIDGRINYASNWSFNFPYISSESGDLKESTPEYITLEDGSTYKLMAKDNDYIAINCFSDKLVLRKDTAQSGGSSLVYKLINKNGDINYFDSKGRWIETRNRFGNSIKVVSSAGSNMIIEDTVGRRVTISKTTSGSITTQTITMPDGSSTKLVYTKGLYGGYSKTVLTSKTDGEGNVTSFEYSVNEDDNYKNALITKITMPTGIENHYEYKYIPQMELVMTYYDSGDFVDKESFSDSADKLGSHVVTPEDFWKLSLKDGKYKYARVINTYMQNKGSSVKINEKNYKYTGNYMEAKDSFNVFCGCLLWDSDIMYNFDDNGDYIRDEYGKREFGYYIYLKPECSCTYYYNYSKDYWSCNRSYCNGYCPVIIDKKYTYTTDILETGGLKTTYSFNQRNQNTSIKVYDGNNIVNETSFKYYSEFIYCNLPTSVTTTEYENNTVKFSKEENYTYTDLYDVKSYIVKSGANELSKVSYEYDYNSLDTSDESIEAGTDYYGICTKTTTKMNSTTSIVEENTLENNYPYANMCVEYTKVKENGVLKSQTQYIRDYLYGNSQGRVTETISTVSDDKRITTSYVYTDGLSGPESVTISDNLGGYYRTEYGYDNNERIVAVANPEGYLTKYGYNKIGDITKVEYYKDRVYNVDINTSGREKDTVTFSYDYGKNKITFNNENGNKEIYDFDSVGNPVSVTKGGTVLSSYTYDTRLRPETYTEGRAKTTYTYDKRDRLTSEIVREDTNVLSNKTYTYENNSAGLKTTEKIVGDTNSATITNITQADVLGRSTMVNEAGNITYYTYDMLGNVTKAQNYITKTSDRTVYLTMDYTYDYAGNVLSAKRTDDTDTANAVTTSATYDMLGRMITSTDGKGNTTEYTYNALGLVTNKKVPFALDSSGNMQYTNYSYSYDNLGNVTRDTVTSGVVNTYTYDHRNRVTQSKSGEQTVNYVYDAFGNMVEYMIANDTDMVHKYTYDSLNRVTKYTDALGNSEIYTYDNNQDMVKKVDRNGKAVTYTYDGLHRMLTEKADGVSNSWTYGLTGGVLTETNNNAVKTYTYNSAGLVSNETTTIGSDSFKITRSYDTRGNNNLNKYYKNGTQYEQIKHTYDNKNRLYEVSVATGTGSTFNSKVKYYYDKNDNVASAHYGNNTYQVYYYNAANLITCMNMVDKSDNSKLEQLVYRYRLDGNMSGKTEEYNGFTTTTAYTYDTTGRLTKEDVVSNEEIFGIAYTYDNAGNRETMTLSGYAGNSTENYSYDDNNRLVSSVKDIGSTSYYTDYTYDKNGNQTKIEKYSKNNDGVFKLSIVNGLSKGNRGIEKFTYNSLNQLTGYESITGQYNGRAGLRAEYEYMANGYRLSKTVNGKETKYLWDGDNIVSELNSENVRTQNYYRGYNLISNDSGIYYMHDIHGNVIETYNGSNNYVDDWYIYNAFGTNKYFDDTCIPSKWGYCDQLRDFETGNYYMRARYYNPESGRFISEDPIKDGINWYVYCGGNPVMFWDPYGLSNDVAVRSAVESKGGSVSWDGKNKTITVKINGKTTVLNEGKDFYISQSENKKLRGKAYMDQEKLFKKCGITGVYANAFAGNAAVGIGSSASKKTTTTGVKNGASIGANASAGVSLTTLGHNGKSNNVETNLVTASAGASASAFPPSIGVNAGASLVTISGSKTATLGPFDITVSGQANIGGIGASWGIGPGVQNGITVGVGGSVGFDIDW